MVSFYFFDHGVEKLVVDTHLMCIKSFDQTQIDNVL